ncbi:MAG: MurR/RpiR family transcriptional regulator [Clostridiales Family XIII bacterium]|nr:MurR/RpiR family transcriptional regulator [Clostridiales Family XIII bacterium]
MSFFANVDFNKLSETDRYIYRYLKDHSAQIQFMRVREIAEASHTSSASVMRFIHKIGYNSYIEFRTNLKNEVEDASNSSDFSDRLQVLRPEIFQANVEMKLEIIADLIIDSENIMFFGMGASGCICEYGSRRLASIGYNTFALSDPTYPVAQKLKYTSNNVLIILSVSGNTNEVIEMVNNFKNKDDFKIITVTSDETSILAQMSNYVLSYQEPLIRFNKYNDMSSQIPSLFLMEALIEKVYERQEEID